jgi:hypothetical protein
MPKKKKTNNGKNKRTKVSNTELMYRGPIALPSSVDNTSIARAVLISLSTITSTGGGIIANVIDNNPNGFGDWANFANCYDEYRVLGLKVRFMPSNPYNVTRLTRPLITLVDRDSAGGMASYAAALNYESSKDWDITRGWTVTARAKGPKDFAWITTAAPVATFWIKLYTDTVSNTTEYGLTRNEILVEFRGRN